MQKNLNIPKQSEIEHTKQTIREKNELVFSKLIFYIQLFLLQSFSKNYAIGNLKTS